MSAENTQKLEILNQFTKKYPSWVNPLLLSMKYCQNANDAYLEMTFSNKPDSPVLLNLDFIAGDDDPVSEDSISLLFLPDADVVANATTFIELDTYSLINCIEGLFTNEAEELINNNHLASIKS